MEGIPEYLPWFSNREEMDALYEQIRADASRLAASEKMLAADIPPEMLVMFASRAGDALEFLNGRKWGYHVVSSLFLAHRPLGFNEISKMIDGVSNRALSTRLKEVVELGLVTRTADPGPPMRTRYELTEHGNNVALLLVPLIYYMQRQQGLLDIPIDELLRQVT